MGTETNKETRTEQTRPVMVDPPAPPKKCCCDCGDSCDCEGEKTKITAKDILLVVVGIILLAGAILSWKFLHLDAVIAGWIGLGGAALIYKGLDLDYFDWF